MRESKSRIKISCRVTAAPVIFSIEFYIVSNYFDSISLSLSLSLSRFSIFFYSLHQIGHIDLVHQFFLVSTRLFTDTRAKSSTS